MNCSEVMELMQLKLDDMEYDHNLLTEHMRRCPACSEMFERLSRLHQQLVELPKVQPAYSLVDAILPQLDELDRVSTPQADESMITAAPVAVPPIQLNSQEETLSRSKDVHGSPAPAVRVNKWFKWKAVSGVIAAGLVVGLFIVNFQPVSQESADFNELSLRQNEEKVAKSTDSSAEQESTEVGSEAGNNQSTQIEKNDNGNGENPNHNDEQGAVDPEQATKETDGNPTEQPMTNEDASKPSSVSKVTPVKPRDSASESSSGKNKGDKAGDTKPNPDSVKPASDETPVTKHKDDKDTKQPPTGGHGITDGAGESTGKGKGINPEEDQASLFTAAIDSTSPDKHYTARWINGQLMLYRYENDSPLIVQIMDFSDAPEQLKWSEDSKQLTVTVWKLGGETKDYIYQVDNKGLHKVESPAKPNEEAVDSPSAPPAEPEAEVPTGESPPVLDGGTPPAEPGEGPTTSPDTGSVSSP